MPPKPNVQSQRSTTKKKNKLIKLWEQAIIRNFFEENIHLGNRHISNY